MFEDFYVNNVPVLQLVSVTEINVCGDLKDFFRRISILAGVGIRSKDECFPIEDFAGYDADRNSTSVLFLLQS